MVNIVAALDLGKDRKRVAQPNRQPISQELQAQNDAGDT